MTTPTQAELLAQSKACAYDRRDLAAQMRYLFNYLLHQLPLELNGKEAFKKTHEKIEQLRKKIERVYGSDQAVIPPATEDDLPDRISLNAIAEVVIKLIVHDGVTYKTVLRIPTKDLIASALPFHVQLKAEAEAKLKAFLENTKDPKVIALLKKSGKY
jgi:hypothetical protein